MFDFLRRPGMRSPSTAICRALEADGLPPDSIAALGVVESPCVDAGRKVTYSGWLLAAAVAPQRDRQFKRPRQDNRRMFS
jgi:hypothetical protein